MSKTFDISDDSGECKRSLLLLTPNVSPAGFHLNVPGYILNFPWALLAVISCFVFMDDGEVRSPSRIRANVKKLGEFNIFFINSIQKHYVWFGSKWNFECSSRFIITLYCQHLAIYIHSCHVSRRFISPTTTLNSLGTVTTQGLVALSLTNQPYPPIMWVVVSSDSILDLIAKLNDVIVTTALVLWNFCRTIKLFCLCDLYFYQIMAGNRCIVIQRHFRSAMRFR